MEFLSFSSCEIFPLATFLIVFLPLIADIALVVLRIRQFDKQIVCAVRINMQLVCRKRYLRLCAHVGPGFADRTEYALERRLRSLHLHPVLVFCIGCETCLDE